MPPVQPSQKSLFNELQECVLREPGDLPGVSIEPYQKRHTPTWPVTYRGKLGSCFPKYFGVQDTIALAQVLIKNMDLFKDRAPSNRAPKVNRLFDIENYKTELEPDLYRKLQGINKKSKPVETVCIYAGFNPTAYNWSIHFYPVFNSRRQN